MGLAIYNIVALSILLTGIFLQQDDSVGFGIFLLLAESFCLIVVGSKLDES